MLKQIPILSQKILGMEDGQTRAVGGVEAAKEGLGVEEYTMMEFQGDFEFIPDKPGQGGDKQNEGESDDIQYQIQLERVMAGDFDSL